TILASRHLQSGNIKYGVHRVESKVAQQTRESSLRGVQAAIVAHSSRRAHPESGLIRIDFPGMQVEHDRLPLHAIHSFDAPLRPHVRQLSEVAATGNWEVHTANAHRRSGQLEQRTAVALQLVRVPRGFRNAVSIVMDREDARVVCVAFLDKDVDGPETRL